MSYCVCATTGSSIRSPPVTDEVFKLSSVLALTSVAGAVAAVTGMVLPVYYT